MPKPFYYPQVLQRFSHTLLARYCLRQMVGKNSTEETPGDTNKCKLKIPTNKRSMIQDTKTVVGRVYRSDSLVIINLSYISRV